MIQPIQSIQSRIKEIYDRIGEINRKVGGIYSNLYVNASEKIYNNQTSDKTTSDKVTKTFQEILNEVMQSQVMEETGKGGVDITLKPSEDLRDIVLSGNKEEELDSNEKMNNVKVNKSIDSIIEEASRKYNIPKELIKAVIKAESNFNPYVISHKNAMGLMQLIPSTAKEMGVSDIFDPYQNIMGGTKYLRILLDKYNNNLFLALASYNAGPERVDKSGGIPEIDETKGYIEKVVKYYKEYSQKVGE